MNVIKISAILVLLLAVAGFSQNFWETVYVRDTLSPVTFIDFDAAGRIFATAKSNYVLRSADRGQTWDSSSPGAPFPLNGVCVHKKSGYVLVGSGTTQDPNSVARIYRSTDHGLTWSLTTFTTASGWMSVARIIEADDGNLLASGVWTGGILRSVDSGKTWAGTNPYPFPAYAGAGYGLDVNPFVPNEVYAGTEVAGNAVWRSADNGANWVMTAQSGLNQGNAASFGFSQNGWIFLNTVHGPYKSNDKGESWTSMTNVFGTMGSFRTADDGTIYVGGVDLIGTYSTYRSMDNGSTWNPITSGLPAGNGKFIKRMFISLDGYLYGDNNYGLFRSVLPVNASTSVDKAGVAAGSMVFEASPNPFRTAVSFQLPAVSKDTKPEMCIFNLSGKLVSKLMAGSRQPPAVSFSWNALGQPAGIYLARLQTQTSSRTKKIYLLK